MHREAEHVDRRLQQRRLDPVPQQGRGRVRLDQIPEPVHDQGWIRLVGVEQPSQRLAQRLHHPPVVGLLQVGRREAAREQQPVALGQRQVEALSEVDEQLPARPRAAGLDEAEVLGREVRLQRELELAQPPARPPETDQLADGLRLPLGLDDHPIEVSGASDRIPLPGV
jgi:hypothetical protein